MHPKRVLLLFPLVIALTLALVPGSASGGPFGSGPETAPVPYPPWSAATAPLQSAAPAASPILGPPPPDDAQKAPALPLPVRPASSRNGYIVPPFDVSHLKGDRLPAGVDAADLPARFDWREAGKVTPVQDQGSCGACYAFAFLGSFESKLLIDGAGAFDLSENNAKECNWEEINNYTTWGSPWGSCDGGDSKMIANLLSQKGTVLEACDAYVASDVACQTNCPYQQTLLGWGQINGNVIPDPNVLKAYIHSYGPVATTIYAGNMDAWDREFNAYSGSGTLYYAGSQNPNHGVLIVGWDDNLTHASGSGAWIVKNSWGTDWGGTAGYGSERGYFTIAYGSASIGMNSGIVSAWQNQDPNGGLLFYDEAGWSTQVGYSGNTTAWGLARFFPAQDTTVTRVEFWTGDATTDVDVYLYGSFDGTRPNNLLRSRLNLSYGEAGYHSVAVEPLPVAAGSEVVAVVKFTNASSDYPLVIDDRGPATAQRTYYSSSGSDGSWNDAAIRQDGDVAIRLRTSHVVTTPTPTRTRTPSPTFQPFTPVAWVWLPVTVKRHTLPVNPTAWPTQTRTPTVGPATTPTRTPTTPPAQVGVISLPGQPSSLAINSSNGRLYVARYEDSDVAVLGLYDLSWVTNALLDEGPQVVRVNPTLGRAYASYGNPLYVLSCADNSVVGAIAEGAYSPCELALDVANQRVYVADTAVFLGEQDRVHIYDGNSGASINTVNLGSSLYLERIALAVNRNTGMAYAAYSGDDTIVVIGADAQIAGRISPSTMAAWPYKPWVAINTATNRLYLRGEATTVVLDLSGSTEIGFLDRNGLIAVDEVRNLVYVQRGSTVYVYDGATNARLRQIPLGQSRLISDMACDAATHRLFLAAPEENQVVVVTD